MTARPDARLPRCACGELAVAVTFWSVGRGPALGGALSWCASCVHDLRDDVTRHPAPSTPLVPLVSPSGAVVAYATARDVAELGLGSIAGEARP